MPAGPVSASRRGASGPIRRPRTTRRCGFPLYGPPCDSADHRRGPFLLPADVDEGDWLELGQLGAYGACLRTRFNGFAGGRTIEVADPPLLATPGYHG